MMILIHYSKDPDFTPRPIETVSGFGAGCFFYPEGAEGDAECEWTNRYRSVWYAPDEVVEEVQRFDPGEIGNDDEIIEVFVRAENLHLVK